MAPCAWPTCPALATKGKECPAHEAITRHALGRGPGAAVARDEVALTFHTGAEWRQYVQHVRSETAEIGRQ